MDEIGIEQARLTLGDIVDKARLTSTPTRITRHGKPGAVVVSDDWYRSATEMIRRARGDGYPETEPEATMKTYMVSAKPWEHGWELHIDGVGVAQAGSFEDQERVARDYIALALEIPSDSFSVEIAP